MQCSKKASAEALAFDEGALFCKGVVPHLDDPPLGHPGVRGEGAVAAGGEQALLGAPAGRSLLVGVRDVRVHGHDGTGFRAACGVPQQQGSLGTVLRHGHVLRQQGFQLLLGHIAVHAVTHQTGHGCAAHQQDGRAAASRAAAVFLRWFTEQQRNLEFAADTGYMPVSSAAFDAIADYPFEQQSYQRLYDVYNEMRLQNTPLSEPGIVGYHAKAKALYDSLRQRQKDYPQRLANGETLEALTEETWQLLCDNA